MALTYEEALNTLESMFGEPWTSQDLDAVLRHHNGHMENTVNTLLSHGEGDPQSLIQNLRLQDEATAQDEALAQQLAQQEATSRRRGAPPGTGRSTTSTMSSRPVVAPPPPPPKGRGTFTTLPPDFLRIPGASPTSTVASTIDQDAALARMLQDELFSQELANNPEFAHLARGRPRTAGGRPIRSGNTSRVAEMPSRSASHRSAGGLEEGPKIMEKISELGENAKKRLQILASQFNQQGRGGGLGRPASERGAGDTSQVMAAQEQRGLLDGDGDDDGEEMELTFSRSATSKKHS